MKKNILFFIVFIFCFHSSGTFAQDVIQEKDSISIYKDINSFSKKSKFSRFIYKLLFRESALKAENLIPSKPKKKEKVVSKYQEGKIIRNIPLKHWILLVIPLRTRKKFRNEVWKNLVIQFISERKKLLLEISCFLRSMIN